MKQIKSTKKKNKVYYYFILFFVLLFCFIVDTFFVQRERILSDVELTATCEQEEREHLPWSNRCIGWCLSLQAAVRGG